MNDPSSSPEFPSAGSSSSSAVVATAQREPSSKRVNPYVGPRPFRRDELFFGREREAASVANSLLSGRIMLLHSPSGAGKTSLIQASVVPSFGRRGFLICAGTTADARTGPAFTALRVNLPPPEDAANRYVFSVVNGLIGSFTDYKRARNMTLAGAVEEFARHHKSQQRQLLVLDQLEEVLTLNPADLEGQIEFFKQVGEALEDNRRWALLAIREDYMGALDKFRKYLPGQLRVTSRLDFLDVKAALRAVQEPAYESGVEFSDDAAQMLVNGLRLVYSGEKDEDMPTVESPYVEPVLLQVVCYRLFRTLSKDQGSKFETITAQNVEDFMPFGKAISKYYHTVMDAAKEAVIDAADEAVIRDAAKEDRRIEQALRDWVEHELIGKHRLRRQTRQKPPVPEPDTALSAMRSLYLIRDDPRPGGAPLWELSHDMLVGPVVEDNRTWRVDNLEKWQVRAEEWRASGKDSMCLLRGSQYLMTAPRYRRRAELTKTEHAYLEASADAYYAKGRLTRLKALLGLFGGLLVLSVIANIVLLVLLLSPL
jgi:hypothetical protein